MESKFNGLFTLVKELWCIDSRNTKTLIIIVTQDLVNNSILSLHLMIWLWLKSRGMVSSVRI